jgi:cell wall-associated NlpC family hydrolase
VRLVSSTERVLGMRRPRRPPATAGPRLLAAAAVIAVLLFAPAPGATAQIAPDTTTTTTAPPPVSTTPSLDTTTLSPTTTTADSTTTTVSPTTTTTVVAAPPVTSSATVTQPPAWTAQVPGPPPPPPLPAGATAADIALAGQLESQIVAQSDVLDLAAERYDEAETSLQTATSHLNDVQSQVTAAADRAAGLQASLDQSQVALRQAALDAYVNSGGTPSDAIAGSMIGAYEQRLSQALADTTLSRAAAKIQQLHGAQRQLTAAQEALAAVQQRAQTDSAAAQAAAAQAQAAAQSAALQQAQLLATMAQVKGNLPQLVAAAGAVQAQAAFVRFTSLNLLDFRPAGPLAPPLPQTTLALQAALAQVGKPYVWGATGPDTFDCSGLTEWSWLQAGVAIPRVASAQQAWAAPVPVSQLQPGDFVFFGNPAHHVGVYVGNGMMVNAPHSGATVAVVPIWWNDLAGFGRAHQP